MFRSSSLLPLALGAGLIYVLQRRRASPSPFRLPGRVALITGGARGLGLVLARQLAHEHGMRVAICARNERQLQRARHELIDLGARVLAVPCDITDRAAVGRMVDQVIEQFGAIDVLINNAGIIQVGPLENLTLRDFELAMNTNFYGTLYTTLAVVPGMRARGAGHIVNIASIGGKIAVPHLLPYSASKFAVAGLSQGLRTELAPYGIGVTTVFPGLMRTGSPRNATVKGRHEKEYAWFKYADSTALLSMDAERAAARIIEALRRDEAELVLTVPAKAAALAGAVFPELTAAALKLAHRLLPDPAEGGPTEGRKGHESESFISQLGANRNTDRAAVENNEL